MSRPFRLFCSPAPPPTDEVLPPDHPARELMRASYAAWHLCQSLLAVREGATDELIVEVRDALASAIILTAQRAAGPGG